MNINLNNNRHNREFDISSLILMLSTVCTISVFLLRTIVDSDTWWQVAIGRDIIAHMSVPHTDHFARAALGRNYHDSHWLFQVVLAIADKLWGMRAVSLLMMALWGASFVFCYRASRYWLSTAGCSLLVFCVAIACSDRFIPRPEVVTYFMVALFYLLMQSGSYRKISQLVLFGFLQMVWSNSHGLFVIGPFMAGCYCLVAMLQRSNNRENDLTETAQLTAVLLVTSCLTPYRTNGWKYAWLLVTEVSNNSPAVFKNLLELTPTFGNLARSFPDFWFYLILLIAALMASITQIMKRQISYQRLLIIAAMLAASVTGRRNIPLFALTVAPLIAEGGQYSIPKLLRSSTAKLLLACFFIVVGYLSVSGLFYKAFNFPVRFGMGMAPEAYSTGLPAFLRRINFKGQLYSPPYLGGYSLYHGFLPIVDGRWEVYDQKTLREVLDAPYDKQAWDKIIAAYDVGGIIVGFGESDTDILLQRLSSDGRFRMVYSDDACTFWIRISK